MYNGLVSALVFQCIYSSVNGLLKQYNTEISGPTRAHNTQLDTTDVELSLMLQYHKNEVSYRNIRIRKL